MKIKADKVCWSQKLNGDVFIEVDDAEDMVPEIKITFMNEDLILTEEEKAEIGQGIFNYILEKCKKEWRKNVK